MNKNIQNIIALLLEKNGIDITQYDEDFLQKSIMKRIDDVNCNNLNDYYNLFKENSNERIIFVESLNINYSEFFRNPFTFSVLETIAIPMITAKLKNSKRKEIRIWSTACSNGQEAYSIAILLEEMKLRCKDDLKYRIFATDKSSIQIEQAKKGKYLKSELNKVSILRFNNCFEKKDKKYLIKPELKSNIEFSVFDLLNENLSSPQDSIFGNFDLIFCSNILFYYNKICKNTILNKIKNNICIDGFIITGESERDFFIKNNYVELIMQSAIFYPKI